MNQTCQFIRASSHQQALLYLHPAQNVICVTAHSWIVSACPAHSELFARSATSTTPMIQATHQLHSHVEHTPGSKIKQHFLERPGNLRGTRPLSSPYPSLNLHQRGFLQRPDTVQRIHWRGLRVRKRVVLSTVHEPRLQLPEQHHPLLFRVIRRGSSVETILSALCRRLRPSCVVQQSCFVGHRVEMNMCRRLRTHMSISRHRRSYYCD
jgi:hypothetical protein